MFRDKDGWRVQWTDKVTGKRRSRRFSDRRLAERYEHELAVGIAEVTDTRENPTFEQYAERWLAEYCAVEKAPSQQRKDRQRIATHLLPILGQVKLRHIRKSHGIDLKAVLRTKIACGRRKALAPQTVNLVLGLAKKMLATAVDLELLSANPFTGIKPLRLSARTFDYWLPEERDIFLARASEIDPPFARLVGVACHTGLRLGELAALRSSDIDCVRAKLSVTASIDIDGGWQRVPTKGREVTELPLNATALGLLTSFGGRGTAAVFERSLFWNARKRLGRLAKHADVRPIRFHDLRHTFASHLAMAGVDLLTIQQLLRHKSYAMTLRYAHLHPSHLAGATDVLVEQRKHARCTLSEVRAEKSWAQRDLNPQPGGYECQSA